MRLKNVIKVLTETEFIGLIGVTALTGALGPGSTTHTSSSEQRHRTFWGLVNPLRSDARGVNFVSLEWYHAILSAAAAEAKLAAPPAVEPTRVAAEAAIGGSRSTSNRNSNKEQVHQHQQPEHQQQEQHQGRQLPDCRHGPAARAGQKGV